MSTSPCFFGDSPKEHILRMQNHRLEFRVPVCITAVLEACMTPIPICCRNIRHGNSWSLINHLLCRLFASLGESPSCHPVLPVGMWSLAGISLGGHCSNSSERCVCLKQDDDSIAWKMRQLSGGMAQPLVLLDRLGGNYEGICKLWNLVNVGSAFLFHGIKGSCQAQAPSFFT